MNKSTIIVICLSLVLVIGIFLSWPKYQKLTTLEEKTNLKKSELQYKQDYLLNLAKLSEELKQYQDSVSKIDSALPSEPSLPNLLYFLQKTSSEYGLVLKSVAPPTSDPIKGHDRIKQYRAPFSLSGSYSSLKSFLSALETTSRFIQVDSVSFTVPKEIADYLSFDLAIKFYSY